MSRHSLSALYLVMASAVGVLAQTLHTLPPSLAAPGTPELTKRAGGTVFGEGVVADWQGNVYFNEMGSNNRTMRLKVGEDTAHPWRKAADAPNGMWLDTQNRIIICQAKAIVRVKAGETFDNQTDTLYKYPNSGENFNDVTGDSKDNLFFTNFNGRSVFFRDAATGETREVLSNRPKPNGIEWDEERKILYVLENQDGKIAAYAVREDFSLGSRNEFATVPSADGVVLDELGNVYAVQFGQAVHVFSPKGEALGKISIPGEQMTNLAFGGADFKTLFIITNKGLYRLPMLVRGYKTGNYSVSLGRSLRPGFTPLLEGNSEFRVDGRLLDRNGKLARIISY